MQSRYNLRVTLGVKLGGISRRTCLPPVIHPNATTRAQQVAWLAVVLVGAADGAPAMQRAQQVDRPHRRPRQLGRKVARHDSPSTQSRQTAVR